MVDPFIYVPIKGARLTEGWRVMVMPWSEGKKSGKLVFLAAWEETDRHPSCHYLFRVKKLRDSIT